MAVLPQERNAGIGTALMEVVEALADEWGLDHLQLGVRTNNEGALRFYRRRGFEPLYVTVVAPRARGAARPGDPMTEALGSDLAVAGYPRDHEWSTRRSIGGPTEGHVRLTMVNS